MADVKIGDELRACGANRDVRNITEGGEEFAYNLEVADFRTYFVGHSKILMHDNTPVSDMARSERDGVSKSE